MTTTGRGSQFGNSVRIIARSALFRFADRFPDARDPLDAWYALMRRREYRSPNELKAEFRSVSLLGDGHVVFNVGGNKYRLVVHVRYDQEILFVRQVLTHEEYDRLSAAGTLIQGRSSNG